MEVKVIYEVSDSEGFCVGSGSFMVEENTSAKEIEDIIYSQFYPQFGDTVEWMYE